jgi:hypothetical protein
MAMAISCGFFERGSLGPDAMMLLRTVNGGYSAGQGYGSDKVKLESTLVALFIRTN